jgi:hypothetical protein
MKMTDVLHSIADLLGQVEEKAPAQSPVMVNVNNGSATANPQDGHGDDGDDSTKHEQPMMVPPLQQKIELMKKLAGIPSNIDKKIELVDDDEPFGG